MELQGSYPVISLSFSNIKGASYADTRKKICYLPVNLYSQYYFLRDSGILTVQEQEFFDRITVDMEDATAAISIQQLSEYLYRYYHKKVIILLDEYDMPMQEAWLSGFWIEIVSMEKSPHRILMEGGAPQGWTIPLHCRPDIPTGKSCTEESSTKLTSLLDGIED